MKRLLYSVLCTLYSVALTSTAQARIGETEVELVARYGRPLFKDAKMMGARSVTLMFSYSGFRIGVVVLDGKSQAEGYTKEEEGRPILAEEINDLLKANSDGRRWLPEKPTAHAPQVWKADDGSRLAWYDARHTLNIRTPTFEAFSNQSPAPTPSRSTEGF